MKDRIKAYMKKEAVLCVAAALALITSFVVPPSAAYLGYVDYRVLALLFSLMIVVAGLSGMGVFDRLLKALLNVVHSMRQLVMVLVMVCFITSMWITNDVALITFVPFAIMVLNRLGKSDRLIPVIVLQTVAANLGSMCTPIGNPQNLYLYSVSGINIAAFLKLLLPITIVSLVLLIISVLIMKNEKLENSGSEGVVNDEVVNEEVVNKRVVNKGAVGEKSDKGWKLVAWGGLFLLSILTVLHLVDYRITLIVVIVVAAVIDPKLFKNVDYSLLITFVAFFIFVGNMKNIEWFSSFIAGCINGREIMVSVIASQCISNVPAAVLLSGFTHNYEDLMLGTNIGGLGTLIASMASLISYKMYIGTPKANVKRYIVMFTLINAAFLVVLLGVVYIIR